MLKYSSKHWDDAGRPGPDCRAALFSAADQFHMIPGARRSLQVQAATFPGLGASLLSVQSSGHEINLEDSRFLTFMMPSAGLTQVRMDRRQHRIGEGQVLALSPCERWTRVERGRNRQFRAHLVKLPLARARREGFCLPEGGNPVVPTAAEALPGLQALLQYLFADLASPEPTLLRRPASDLFAALVIEHLRLLLTRPPELPRSEPGDAILLRQAEEFMRTHLGSPLTVPLIAQTCGVSPRRLQAAFRSRLGQNPWERVTALRLQAARAQLLTRPDLTVTEIALDCGFSHLGRFARSYGATFGEPPSATLRRARLQP